MDLILTLIPLLLGSAILPLQIAVTILLLQSPGGRAKAVAWVAGMAVVRLLQGLVFGVILGTAAATGSGDGPGAIKATLLLVVAVVFLVSAVRQLTRQPDEDAPPPKWMAMIAGITTTRAFLYGAGIVVVAAKLWAFTLGALAVIADSGLAGAESWIAYLLFVAGALSIHLVLIAVAFLAPARADAILGRLIGALERHNRMIMIVLGLVFGAWFLVQSLTAFGLLGG